MVNGDGVCLCRHFCCALSLIKRNNVLPRLLDLLFSGDSVFFTPLNLICYILMSIVAQTFPRAEADSILQVMLELIGVYVLTATIAWGIGAMLYYYAFKSNMIPRVLSIWGLIAMPLAVLSAILVYFCE